jgi:hypothetical protein
MLKFAERRTPLEIITGDTPDISEYVDFDFYNWSVSGEIQNLGQSK